MNEERFIGAWRIRSLQRFDADGSVAYPFGESPGGLIMYTPDGYMSATIMRSGRDDFPSDEYASAGEGDQSRALRSYLAYTGAFTVEDDEKMIHHVEASLLPNWTGGEQVRYYSFDGDTLTLSTHPIGDETPGRTVIVWEKA